MVLDLLKVLQKHLALWLVMFAEHIVQADLQGLHQVVDGHAFVRHSACFVHATMAELLFVSSARRFIITFGNLNERRTPVDVFSFCETRRTDNGAVFAGGV